MTCCKYSI